MHRSNFQNGHMPEVMKGNTGISKSIVRASPMFRILQRISSFSLKAFHKMNKAAIFVNNADSKAAQMFTLAHELAHIWFGASAAFDLVELQPADIEIEKVCNTVAAEFLVPEVELKKYWDSVKKDADRFQLLARQFKVSEIVAARRALDLGLIPRSEFFDFYQNRYLPGLKKNPDSSGGDFYLNQPYRISRRFANAVISATMEGRLLYQEAYRLTGIKGKTFAKFAASLGYGGEL